MSETYTIEQLTALPDADLNALVGRVFGYWTVIGLSSKKRRGTMLRCKCACGTEREIKLYPLKIGKKRSCGCMRVELMRQTRQKHIQEGTLFIKTSPEYHTWSAMIKRCHNPNDKSFGRYGGRGITVCEAWQRSFQVFLADMGRRPTPGHSIDRIDNSKGYEPGNCRWATIKEQNRNRRGVIKLTYRGITKTLPEWAEDCGLSADTLRQRIADNWTTEEALSLPLGSFRKKPKKPRLVCSNGHPQTSEVSYQNKRGARCCRICNRERSKRYEQKRK